MKFYKYEATGNDFIMLKKTGLDWRFPSQDEIRRMCRRRTGIGADGLIVLAPSSDADVRMTIFNADGSKAEMCGNGIRALFLFAADTGIFKRDVASIETDAGIKEVERTFGSDGVPEDPPTGGASRNP